MAVRFLLDSEYATSALLYVAVPYGLALLIAVVKPASPETKWWHATYNHSLVALVVFLGSAIVLFEGFICVLFFLPIYFVFVLLGLLTAWALDSQRRRHAKRLVSLLPLLVFAMSMEGTSTSLSFARDNQITIHQVVDLNLDTLHANMRSPIDLQKPRSGIIKLFPMPYEIAAEGFAPGAVHTVKTRYHRWFVTNTHEGALQFQLQEMSRHRIAAKVISDTSYFAGYLHARSFEVEFKPLTAHQTEVVMQLSYQRRLDPAWYFHPIQQLAVKEMGHFLIQQVLKRER